MGELFGYKTLNTKEAFWVQNPKYWCYRASYGVIILKKKTCMF